MNLHTEIFYNRTTLNPPVVFLHGFTGSAQDWREIAEGIEPNHSVYAIDLPGHGKSLSPADLSCYTAEGIVSSIKETLEFHNLNRVILCGYSMGGRAALAFTVKYSENISALILESATAGIPDFDDRRNRILNDEKIASLISSGTIENFIDYWMRIPLFESQKILPKEKLEIIKKSKLQNNSVGLANSLKGFGTGNMPDLWNDLKDIKFPVLLITGELDNKFTMINKELVRHIKNGIHHIVPECGHNVHLEKPEHFLNLTNEFLRKH